MFIFFFFFPVSFDPDERRQRPPPEKGGGRPAASSRPPPAGRKIRLRFEQRTGPLKAVKVEKLADELQGDDGLCRRGRKRRRFRVVSGRRFCSRVFRRRRRGRRKTVELLECRLPGAGADPGELPAGLEAGQEGALEVGEGHRGWTKGKNKGRRRRNG